MKAIEIMTRRIIAIHEDETVAEAARIMLQNDISGLPVIDRAGKPIGIVTEGDLLRRVETGTEKRRPRWLELLVGPTRLAEEYVRTHARRISDIMSRDLVTVAEDTPLSEVVGIMERRRVKRVLVLRGSRLVGLVTRGNLLQALAQQLPDTAPASQSDESIRAQIETEISKLKWKPHASINPIVKQSAVYLHGTVFDDQEVRALRVLCENVPGVSEVHDQLVVTEPY